MLGVLQDDQENEYSVALIALSHGGSEAKVTAQCDSQGGQLCRGHTANFHRGCHTLLAPPTADTIRPQR
ncbi:hypothetical protein E2C01_001554 [Portunus trituberculatus]|uniref:Uncharacterized protein n=1 Tax=Portunus trituberculatus TaxID=210409 RepID=A0A5B7CKQ4_PORTR|nr:hypothetical protein [Portunus trituberculatus]